MENQISDTIRSAINEGRLELFFNDSGKLMNCFSGLNAQEREVFENLPERTELGNQVFIKTHESKYFPTMNGLEGHHQITEVSYEVIRWKIQILN